ncbi:hypothetical protein IFM89_004755, partial [Coptis chinensis]
PDFTQQLVETGAEDDVSMALVVFSLQYIFFNHELWKYRVKHARWKVTLKVLELMKICVMAVPISEKLGGIVKDSLLSDPSVHSSLYWIMCITTETLEPGLYEVEEIEGLRMSVCSALDVVFAMLTAFPKHASFSPSNVVIYTTNPIPVVTAVISLTSYFWDPAIQVGAAKVLSVLCVIAENTQPYKFGNVSLVSDDKQFAYALGSVCSVTLSNFFNSSISDCSGGKELNSLILSDLYYHLQGELEGRKMNSPPFKELAQFLLQSNFSQTEHNYKRDFLGHVSDVYVFDLVCIRKDLGLPFWDHSKWEASKAIVEKMLSYMQDANLMSFFLSSKLRALKALATILSVYGGNWTEIKTGSIGRGMSETLLSSCVEGVCKCLQTTVESLVSAVGPSADIINFFGAQAELLLCLIRLLCKRFSEKTNRLLSLRIFALVLKTSATSLRVLCSIVPSMDALVAIMNFFLLALLLSAECFQSSSSFQEKEDKKSAEAFTEVSLLCQGLLPILCSCTEIVDCCNLSVALMDLILNGFLTSSTWLPIIQKHLRLQLVIQKLRERDSFPCKTVFSVQNGSGVPISTGEDEKRQHIWGLGLTVVTVMIYSLGGSSSCVDFVDTVIPYFFSEKDYVMLYHLDLPYLPSDVLGKKRARTQKTQTSLTALREIEHTLMFICVAAKHRKSWLKSMKEMNSQIRERSIHLLA